MARINKFVRKHGVYGTQGTTWLKTFYLTRLSKRQIRKIEDTGKEVVFGKCFNCGWTEAILDPFFKPNLAEKKPPEYPVCRRCGALWGRDEDRYIESHA